MQDIYEWYKIFKIQDFLDMNIPSHLFTLNLESRGQRDFLITKGKVIGVSCEDVFIPLVFNNNPQKMDNMALYTRDGYLFWGFLVES